ncbi:hypothetical protein RCL_jg4443.t1 [Rhizophagus clarus]|uniref:Uncharacterized protein n=1 Tax=Rhizophagus clarus TaxID=94130 RepID=A0A8H3QEG1_9GLOM|nr:hypothetical protein RCL_jg4443.t1 [Rhizophagus clarus]
MVFILMDASIVSESLNVSASWRGKLIACLNYYTRYVDQAVAFIRLSDKIQTFVIYPANQFDQLNSITAVISHSYPRVETTTQSNLRTLRLREGPVLPYLDKQSNPRFVFVCNKSYF